jgi:aminobutyraldehyde dehydrogenase
VEGNGFFFEPTVLADAQQDDEIVRREVFGPVVSVTKFTMKRRCWLGQRFGLRPGVVGMDRRRGRAHRLAARCSTAAPG